MPKQIVYITSNIPNQIYPVFFVYHLHFGKYTKLNLSINPGTKTIAKASNPLISNGTIQVIHPHSIVVTIAVSI